MAPMPSNGLNTTFCCSPTYHPHPAGKYVYRNGRLQPTSIDLYLVTEFCELGDLFHLKGQLSEVDVRSLMFQLLQVGGLAFCGEVGAWCAWAAVCCAVLDAVLPCTAA